MKKCKYCKFYDKKMARFRWSCVVEFVLDKPIPVDECTDYARKWWLIWRPK